MYLSRLVLNPASRAVRNDLADCQGLHRTLLAAFPRGDGDRSGGARAQFGVLFRVDASTRGQTIVLAQSTLRPDWTRLPMGYLRDTADIPQNPATKDLAPLLSRIDTGTTLRFRLRANPTKRIGKQGSAERPEWKGKRVELRREEDQLDWLAHKGEQHGFRVCAVHTAAVQGRMDVPNLRTTDEPKLTGRHPRAAEAPGRRPTMRLAFGSALFDGVLEVTDAALFRQALESGIGSGKAYGFGLLSVVPVNR